MANLCIYLQIVLLGFQTFRPLYVSPHERFAQTLVDSPHSRFAPITFRVVHYLQWLTGTSINEESRHVSSSCRRDFMLCAQTSNFWCIIFLWAPSHVAKPETRQPTLWQRQPYSSQWATWPNLTVTITDKSERTFSSNCRPHGVSKVETVNRLHAVEPTVNLTEVYCLPLRDEIIMHRLRIGHTYMTRDYLFFMSVISWRGIAHLNAMYVKLNPQLSAYCCIVGHGMQSVWIIPPSRRHKLTHVKLTHVASLI